MPTSAYGTLALAHDYLTQRGGAERVVAGWLGMWPEASLYTALYEPSHTFPEFQQANLVCSPLNRSHFLRSHYRTALPLYPLAWSRTTIDADVVLASSSGWAHGLRTDGRLVVYCHSPARWLYQPQRYLATGAFGRGVRLARFLGQLPLRRWDLRSAQRADVYVANSAATQAIIRQTYGIDAEVIHPFVRPPHVMPEISDLGDVLVIARLLPYKNVDLIIAAAQELSHLRFRIVGDGPQRGTLEKSAPSNVTFLGSVADEQLWREYRGTRLHVAMSYEDFGITPLEAAAAGVPTLARTFGGYLDTVTPATGVLLDTESVDVRHVIDGIKVALRSSWLPADLSKHVQRFSAQTHYESLNKLLWPIN